MTFIARVIVTEADGSNGTYWYSDQARIVVQRQIDQWKSGAALHSIKVDARLWEPSEFGYGLTLADLIDAPLQIVADVLREL